MIIDFHFHPFCKEATWDEIDKISDAMWGLYPTQKKRMSVMLKTLATKYSIDNYIGLMDNLQIEKAIIVSFNIKTAYGAILVNNDDLAMFIEKYPKRFIGFAGIDPPSSDALDQLDYAINSLDLKGVKLVPPVQKFDPKNEVYNPIWEKIVDLNIPLWIHGGHQVSTAGSIAKYGHPMRIDDLAMRFPEMTIIIGHMGTPWFWDTFSVVIRHPNVYVDISAHPELYQYFPWDAYTNSNIEDKVLFASDHPLCHWNQIIPAVKQLPISDGFRNRIFKKNAEKLLKSFKII
ncbi:MAG: amidohydrolase family protein [Promethearchaeati archaeon]